MGQAQRLPNYAPAGYATGPRHFRGVLFLAVHFAK